MTLFLLILTDTWNPKPRKPQCLEDRRELETDYGLISAIMAREDFLFTKEDPFILDYTLFRSEIKDKIQKRIKNDA